MPQFLSESWFSEVEKLRAEAGDIPVPDAIKNIKLNVVVARDYNDMDVVDLARRAREHGWHVRFIELMPLGGGETAHLALSQFVPSSESKARIEQALGTLTPVPPTSPADEARNYRFAAGDELVVDANIEGFIC